MKIGTMYRVTGRLDTGRFCVFYFVKGGEFPTPMEILFSLPDGPIVKIESITEKGECYQLKEAK